MSTPLEEANARATRLALKKFGYHRGVEWIMDCMTQEEQDAAISLAAMLPTRTLSWIRSQEEVLAMQDVMYPIFDRAHAWIGSRSVADE